MLLFPIPPCTAGRNLLGRGLCGSFLVPFAWWRLVQASLSPLSSPSISQGLCTLVLASQALPLQRGAGVHLIWLSRPALCFSGLYSLILAPDTCPPHRRVCVPLPVLSHWPDLCRGACVFFWLPRATLCAARVVHAAQVCTLPLSQYPGTDFAL